MSTNFNCNKSGPDRRVNQNDNKKESMNEHNLYPLAEEDV